MIERRGKLKICEPAVVASQKVKGWLLTPQILAHFMA